MAYDATKARALLHPPGAPAGPACGFGREKTADEIRARIEWETWAEHQAELEGCTPMVTAHSLTRVAYESLLGKMVTE